MPNTRITISGIENSIVTTGNTSGNITNTVYNQGHPSKHPKDTTFNEGKKSVDTRIQDIARLISEHSRRLQKLEERKARFGSDAAPHILTEIEDIRSEIAALRLEQEQLENSA